MLSIGTEEVNLYLASSTCKPCEWFLHMLSDLEFWPVSMLFLRWLWYIGWCWNPLLFFLVSSRLYMSQLYQSLDGVKLKQVLHEVPQKAGEAGYSLCSPYSGRRNSFWLKSCFWTLSNAGLKDGALQAKWRCFSFTFCVVIFRVFFFFGCFAVVVLLCWSFLTGL